MDAREFLQSYYQKEVQLRNLEKEIRKLEALAEGSGIDTTKEKVDSSNSYDQVADVAVKVADKKARAEGLKHEILGAMERVALVIRQVGDPLQAKVLHMRYIELERWSVIADAVPTVERNVFRIHDRGLSAVQSILDQGITCQ